MQKSKILLILILTSTLFIFGCSQTSEAIKIAKELNHNLNVLSTTLNKLDSISNSYLTNPDINPNNTTNINANTLNLCCYVPAKTENQIKKITNKELTKKDNKLSPTKKKIKIQPQEIIKENNKTYKDSQFNTNTNEKKSTKSHNSLTKNIYKTNNQPKNNINKNEKKVNNDNQNIPKIENKENKHNNYQYYKLKQLKYNPKYLLNYDNLESDNYLNNYVNKVRTVYLITNDVMEANSTLKNYKNNVLQNINTIKKLNDKILSGIIEPNNQQIQAINNYLTDIKTIIKRLKKCNGTLTNKVNNINKIDSENITTSIDVVKSNYLSILNHIDTRINYLNNSLIILNEIENLLLESKPINIKNENIENNFNKVVNKKKSFKNIDSYKPENTKLTNPNHSKNLNKNNIEKETINHKNLNNNTNINESNNNNLKNENLNNYNSNIIPNNNTNNYNNGFYNTGLGNTNEDRVNTPNGIFQNGIIYQNNLNNGVNNGVNGLGTGNGDGNLPYTPNSINQTNKNVDTYGYNTIIDMVNRGTVNNGINTLNLNKTNKTCNN